MSSIRGYFLPASKSGGFTIHPWIRRPSLEVYHSSSTGASCFPCRTSSFTAVSCVNVAAVPDFGMAKVTMSFGLVGVDRTPTAIPALFIAVTVRKCFPDVTGRYCPAEFPKYRFFEPSLSTLKYTPLLSLAHVTPEIGRSRSPEIARGFEPSAFIIHSPLGAHAE